MLLVQQIPHQATASTRGKYSMRTRVLQHPLHISMSCQRTLEKMWTRVRSVEVVTVYFRAMNGGTYAGGGSRMMDQLGAGHAGPHAFRACPTVSVHLRLHFQLTRRHRVLMPLAPCRRKEGTMIQMPRKGEKIQEKERFALIPTDMKHAKFWGRRTKRMKRRTKQEFYVIFNYRDRTLRLAINKT